MDTYKDTSLPIEERVENLLDRLTLEQKTRLVSGTGMNPNDYTNADTRVPGAAGYTYPLEDLEVKSIALADGPAGLRILPEREGTDKQYFATAFPVATALASSWDVEVLHHVGAAMGHEVKEYGVDVLLAPGMNIHRNPLGGRNFEYYSEDPFVSGKMAAAMVQGIESNGVGATIKHYAANNQETNRFVLDTIVGERTLREIYLRGFEIAVKDAQPWAIMSSYNLINGTYAPQDRSLMTDVLRGEWDYQGIVMTDWFAGDDAVEMMNAGNDLIMPGTPEFSEQLEAGLKDGSLTESTLDTNVRRILKTILQSPTVADYAYSDEPDLTKNAKIARQAAADGIVLLKNESSTLPLKSNIKTIAVLGNTSYEFISGGVGSGDVNEAYTISLVDALTDRGFPLDDDLAQSYAAHIASEKAKQPEMEHIFELPPPLPEMPLTSEQLIAIAANSDIALLTIGRNSGEFLDRQVDGDFNLTESELKLIADASAAFHAVNKKLVVILNIGNVVETASWRDQVDAIVLPWQGGQEAGNAVLDILTGDVNPAAKLATTFPVRYADVPSAKDFPGEVTSDEVVTGIGGFAKGQPSKVQHSEGIYVGYRYYDTFEVAPAYEFGYGLSYTQFGYSDCRVSSETFEDCVDVSITVTNTGEVPGREVVQLYLAAPQSDLHKPVKELKGFAKTRNLQPGESQQLSFTLNQKLLASFDTSERAWIAEAGNYQVLIGASSRNIQSKEQFSLTNRLIVETVPTQLDTPDELQELQPNA